MSLADFWMNLRTATRFLAPRATADSPSLDSAKIERILKGAAVWLTPKSVAGFNLEDFDFLPSDERRTLAESVNHFRDIAQQVTPDKPATDQQIQQALPHFLRIVEILRPAKYADPEALVIGKKVEQRLPPQFSRTILELRFETGTDAGEEPALWIWVILKDEGATTEEFLSNAKTIREWLENTVSELGVSRWPYVRFRTDAELKQLEKMDKK